MSLTKEFKSLLNRKIYLSLVDNNNISLDFVVDKIIKYYTKRSIWNLDLYLLIDLSNFLLLLVQLPDFCDCVSQ